MISILSATEVASLQPNPSLEAVMPASTLQAQFEQLLMGDAIAKPELGVCEQVQKFSTAYQSQMPNVQDFSRAVQDPAQALEFQMRVASAALAIDVTAKLAGAAAQAINRLVSIQ